MKAGYRLFFHSSTLVFAVQTLWCLFRLEFERQGYKCSFIMWRSCVCRESFHGSVCCLDTKLLPPVQRAGWGPAPAHYSSSSHHPSGKSAPLVSLSLQCKWWVAEDIGQFSETGLHDWTSFAVFCTRSHEGLQLSLPGWFLSRCWFTLCITMEVAKQDRCQAGQMPPLLQLQKLQGKGDGGWKKVSLHHFLADQKSASSWKKMRFWASTSCCLLPDTF